MGMQTIKIRVKFSFLFKVCLSGGREIGQRWGVYEHAAESFQQTGERRQMSMFSSPSGYACWLKGTSPYIIANGYFWNKASLLEIKQNNAMAFPEVAAFQGHFLWSLGSQVIVLIQSAPHYLGYLLFRIPQVLSLNEYCIKI